MHCIELKLRAGGRMLPRLVEQGIPVEPVDPGLVESFRLVDERGEIIPAVIEPDGRDENGRTVWIRVSTVVEAGEDRERRLRIESRPDLAVEQKINITDDSDAVDITTPFYQLKLTNPGFLSLSTVKGQLLNGKVDFQLWPDARSIVGAGAGTCRLASFVPEGWSVEEQSGARCLVVLKGRVPKFAPYTSDPDNIDPTAQFDCELELICNAFSPIIRFRWTIENHTVWQAYLERYAISLPLAGGAGAKGGERSDDGKFLSYASAETPGGTLTLTANFIEALGAGAGINIEQRRDMGELTLDEIASFAGGEIFEPHHFLSADEDRGSGLNIVQGGINPPPDGDYTAASPEAHRLFYLGMGRTFDGSILVNCTQEQVDAELNPVYFELDPDYYSTTGALPENGDPVCFGEFRDKVFAAAEWMLQNQWKGTLWWGEWWREWDVYRRQGIESTANGNNPLGPLYHYWRTGDTRFIDSAKRAMEFQYDIQLSKRRTGLGPFFQCRRFLIDKMEWVHMRYQRIEGPIKAAHFFGDRRLRTRIIDAMRTYAENLVCPNGAPGYGSGGPDGKRVPAGSDCTNFQEVLVICWRETGEERFRELARKMANWTIREMNKWDWEKYVGNSYGWHFLMRGMLSTLKATGNKRHIDWYLDMANKNMIYPVEEILHVQWMNWLIVEAQRMSGETWLLDELHTRTAKRLEEMREGGSLTNLVKYPWSKWPTTWDRVYDAKPIVAYVPVLAARRAALGMDE